MEATTSKPTVLAKLLGFYTVEIKNLENGNIQAKADLLVMENLFYDQKIAKTFDLKGIQGRKVKAGTSGNSSSKSSKTLFDGEWIEGMFEIVEYNDVPLKYCAFRPTANTDACPPAFEDRVARGHQERLGLFV